MINENYKPTVQLHKCIMMDCLQCESEICTHYINNELPTVECSCGQQYSPKELKELGFPSWFYDCDICGYEIICQFPVIGKKTKFPKILECPKCQYAYKMGDTAERD